jgi:diguanylate cyclase (GGDEF)-like protein
VVTNNFFGGRYARQYGLVETPIMFDPVGLYYATAKGTNAALLQRIDHYLERWRRNPDSIYFSAMRDTMAPPPITLIPRHLRIALAAALGSAFFLLLFTLLLRMQVRRATQALRYTHRRLNQVLNASPVVLYSLRPENGVLEIEWVSANIERLFGFTPAETAAPGWFEKHLHPEDRELVLANMERQAGLSGALTQEYRILDAKGRTRYIHDEMRVTGASENSSRQVVGTWTDLTQAVKQAAELRFLTQYEPNTGLPNRARLHERLERVVSRAARKSTQIAVLSIDLDRFRYINDTLGHVKGDALLRMAARRIESLAGVDDTLAKVGDDSFVLVLGGNTSARHASGVAEKLLQAFAQPLSHEHPLIVTASIGISVFPDDAADAATLLKHADLALYEAKSKGRNTYRLFAAELTAGVKERVLMETALRGAVSRHELILHYQPQLDLHTHALVGVEALVRWNHPELGLLQPAEFIPIAEETGIIQEIGAWTLKEACNRVKSWQDAGMAFGSIAVNLSARQFEQPSLADQIAGVLRTSGLAPDFLVLEITESTIMREPEKAIAVLHELKRLGVCLAIDDFGTGHSSLAYVKRLPVDRVKIDQAFVRDIGRDANDEAICRTVIELGRNLNLETVAEGIEREEQAAFLRAEGCTVGQGYLFGRPLPADALQRAWGKQTATLKGH